MAAPASADPMATTTQRREAAMGGVRALTRACGVSPEGATFDESCTVSASAVT